MNVKRSFADKVFDNINYVVLTILLVSVVYPLYFIVIASFSNPMSIFKGEVMFWIKDFTLKGYETIFAEKSIWVGYRNSLMYMVVGTSINLVVTIPAAFALARKDLKGRRIIMLLFVFTMFFSGGLIPSYLIVTKLKMYNTIWALMIPCALSVYNLIITRSFFEQTLPQELLDASRIDGCNDVQYFVKIALPLSKAIIAVMALYYGVGHWNSYFSGLIYLRDKALYPLQLILRSILIQSKMTADMVADSDLLKEQRMIAESIKYGVIIIASLPVLIIYPFVQKYFVQGVMIGAVKG